MTAGVEFALCKTTATAYSKILWQMGCRSVNVEYGYGLGQPAGKR